MTLPEKCPCQTISLIFWNINELHKYLVYKIRVLDATILEEGPVCFGCAFLWQKHLFSAPKVWERWACYPAMQVLLHRTFPEISQQI